MREFHYAAIREQKWDSEILGLIAAIYALTLMAYGADGKFRFREGLILSSLLAVGSYLVFICLLKMQIPLWPAFLKF